MTEGNELDTISLDEIMTDTPADTPEVVSAPAEPEQAGQERDEKGRFTAKSEAEEPATPEPTQPTENLHDEHETGKVPLRAVHEARDKERAARERAETLERELAEMRGMVQALTRQSQPQPAQQQAPKPPDFWENPNEFVNHALTPVQQQVQQTAERFSKMLAIKDHGQEAVEAAYKALGQSLQTDPGARADYQRIMSAEHPYEELVRWHKTAEARARIGNDPDAWLNAEIEKRLADPAFQAQVIERARTNAAANTNRSAPVTSLPPSLGRLPAGGNQPGDDDVSDAGIFAHAMGR